MEVCSQHWSDAAVSGPWQARVSQPQHETLRYPAAIDRSGDRQVVVPVDDLFLAGALATDHRLSVAVNRGGIHEAAAGGRERLQNRSRFLPGRVIVGVEDLGRAETNCR